MNLLNKEKSPYLKQHENNPVHWHAWNKETLQKAKQEDRLMLISIGYSTCHWCHVMERESFEKEEVALVMNTNFINVKVDREERADVDDYYMDAVHLMGQNGGWPLNCIALPDGRPIWAGTYVPKEKWIDTLNQLADLFKNDRDKVEEYAVRLNNGLKQMNLIEEPKEAFSTSREKLFNWTDKLKQKFDSENGGMQRAPKFPMPDVYRFMLRQYALTADTRLMEHISFSLHKMASAGLFDQLGGGFARYSVDAEWFAPHFEKMLYDNGQLLSLYSETYAFGQNERLKEVIELSVMFLERELKDENGAFYCGLDADSEGEEGKYYVFTSLEIDEALGADAEVVKRYFDFKTNGNWENGVNILRIKSDISEPTSKALANWELIRKRLLAFREERVKPGLDNKILVAWNALTIIGLLDAYKMVNVERAKKLALDALDFILNHMQNGNDLKRVYHSGTLSVSAFLEDYATLISALISAFETSQNRTYLYKAKDLTNHVIEHFSSESSSLFFSTSKAKNEVNVRKVAYQDNVIPSANAVMAENLFRLGHVFLKNDYLERSKQMLATVFNSMDRDIEFFSYWGKLYQLFEANFYEIVISGPNAEKWLEEINGWFLPNKVVVLAVANDNLLLSKDKHDEEKTRAFLCEKGLCHLPHSSLKSLENEIWN